MLRNYRLAYYIHRRAQGGISRESALRHMPARWRALKRLAIQGHDTDRELEFLSGEVRSARFAGDWPLPWPVWKATAWSGVLRFWAGLLYQTFSDFGRSLLRPLIAWSLCIIFFAAYYLGQNEQVAARRKQQGGYLAVQYGLTAWNALGSPPYCYPGNAPYTASTEPKEEGFSGLVEKVRASTNLVNEAFSVSYHNAIFILDSSGDQAHRAFGCLYGVERYGDNPIAFVPRNVSNASSIQKLLSAIFIFLFGIAVRTEGLYPEPRKLL